MFGRYSERAARVINLAQDEARRLNTDSWDPEHLLLALIREGQGVGAKTLHNVGVDLDRLRIEVEKAVGRDGTSPTGDIQVTPRAKRVVMELAVEEARQLGHRYVGTEHLLLALIQEGEGPAARLLGAMEVDLAQVRREVTELLGSPTPPPPAPSE